MPAERRRLTPSEIHGLLVHEGFTGGTAIIGTAIILAESGGDPHATNTNTDGSRDRGLFQINDRAHPDVPDNVAYDILGNVRAGHKISNGGHNWLPWSTYHNGAYKRFLVSAGKQPGVTTKNVGFLKDLVNPTKPLPGLDGKGLKGPFDALNIPNPVNALDGAGKVLGAIGSKRFWLDTGKIILGTVVLSIGVVELLSQSKVAGTVGNLSAVSKLA